MTKKSKTILIIAILLIAVFAIGYAIHSPATNQEGAVASSAIRGSTSTATQNSCLTQCGYEVKTKTATINPGSGLITVDAGCSYGKRVLGGGYSLYTPGSISDYSKVYVTQSTIRNYAPDSWEVVVQNTSPDPVSIHVDAICAS